MWQWVLSLMLMLQPNAPWKSTYESTAQAIAEISKEKPLFKGEKAKEKTATLLVSLAWFESRFNPKAIGDHGKSFGLYQQQGRGEIFDPKIATMVAVEQIQVSFRVCSNQPLEYKLGWYAAGGPTCNYGHKESKHRMLKANWLFKNKPFIGEEQ